MKNCVTNRVHLMSRVTGVAAASAAVSSVASSVVPVVSSSLIPSSVVPLIPSSVVSSLRIRVRRSSRRTTRRHRRHSWHSWHSRRSRSSRHSRNSRGRRLTRTPTILLIQTTQHTAQLPLKQPPITHLIVYTLVDGVLRVLVQNHKAALIITLFTHTHSRNLVQRGSVTHRRSARTIGSRLNDGTIRKTHTNGTAAQENAVQLRGRLRSSTRLEFDKTKASTRIGLQTHAFLGHLC